MPLCAPGYDVEARSHEARECGTYRETTSAKTERVQLPGGDKNAMIAYSAQRILGGNDAHFSVWPAQAYSPSLPLASWCQTSERMRRNFDVTPMAHLKE
jgi:hypothetical protein